jgi:hypothetical protein
MQHPPGVPADRSATRREPPLRRSTSQPPRRLAIVAAALAVGALVAVPGPVPALAGTDPCHEGTASLSAEVGTVVHLTGCLRDRFENGVPDEPVIWRLDTTGIVPQPGGDDPAFFVGIPDQVTDAVGEAHADVSADQEAAGHLTNVFFCWDPNREGICDFDHNLTALFQISWTAGPPPPEPACVVGTSGDDLLDGTPGADCLRGKTGNDELLGHRGSDDLFGGRGADVLRGGKGPDTLNGGRGRHDLCVGGLGVDAFTGCETIVDA